MLRPKVIAADGGSAVAVEVNSETDFVAKRRIPTNGWFICDSGIGCCHVEALAGASIDGKAVSDIPTDKIATIGENMTLRRMVKINGESAVSTCTTQQQRAWVKSVLSLQ